MVGWRAQARSVRERFAASRLAGRRHAEELARLSAARQEADYLNHVHDELAKLKPEPGEEEALAERRAVMMQAKKSWATFATPTRPFPVRLAVPDLCRP